MRYKNLAIQENYLLKKLTTFKIGGEARYLAEINKRDEIETAMEFARENKLEILILGGGSNMLVSDAGFKGLVLKINIRGFEILEENSEQVILKIGSGEVWDGIVNMAVKENWWGIENMSAIPGRAGGFVAQNAGAYGQECVDVLDRVEVYDVEDGRFKIFTKQECVMSYRSSLFNKKYEKYIIVEVILKLNKKKSFKLDYPDVKRYFEEKGINDPELKNIREAIIGIRRQKLPNWGVHGNAGSFVKNFSLSEKEYQVLYNKIEENFSKEILEKLEGIKNKFIGKGGIKIPTAFLVDICGLKGKKVGGAKVHEKQPLVLMNDSKEATAKDVMNLFKKIRQTVHEKTGMKIEPETRLIGFSNSELENYFEL